MIILWVVTLVLIYNSGSPRSLYVYNECVLLRCVYCPVSPVKFQVSQPGITLY